MTGTVEPLDVIVLDDGVQSVAVRLLSPSPQYGYYDAEIVIRSGFVNATVRTGLNADVLDDWAALLEAVEESDAEAGETDDVFTGNWPGEGRAAFMAAGCSGAGSPGGRYGGCAGRTRG